MQFRVEHLINNILCRDTNMTNLEIENQPCVCKKCMLKFGSISITKMNIMNKNK